MSRPAPLTPTPSPASGRSSLPHILDRPPETFSKIFAGERYRSDQVLQWAFSRRVRDFDAMTNLPQSLREDLKARFLLRSLSIEKEERSALDGTRKWTFRTQDGRRFACVFLPHKNYQSLCLSSQVGCAWACTFCASGLVPFERNLTAGEILDQIFWAEEESGARLRNVLFMGMGEPLANFAQVLRALGWMAHPQGLAMHCSRIVVSTTGLAPQIVKLAEEGPGVGLALSLHAPHDALRRRIMPKSARFSIAEVLAACRTYVQKTGAEFTVEYVLLRGTNDSPALAKDLARLLKGARFPAAPKVNLIPQNPVAETGLHPSSPETAQDFFDALKREGLLVHTRKPQGQDLEAACGQLL